MSSVAQPPAPQASHSRTVFLTELLLDHLPLFPSYLQQLQGALDDCGTNLDAACAALERHPVVHANFVRIARIAIPADQEVTLDHLVLLLGKRRTWTTAVAAFVFSQIDVDWASPFMRRVAQLGLLHGANALAAASPDEDAPEQAYVAGVFSILGLLPLIDTCLDETADWIGLSAAAIARQREHFGTDCIELGQWIRLLWHLPMPAKTAMEQRSPQAFGMEEYPISLIQTGEVAGGNLVVMPAPVM